MKDYSLNFQTLDGLLIFIFNSDIKNKLLCYLYYFFSLIIIFSLMLFLGYTYLYASIFIISFILTGIRYTAIKDNNTLLENSSRDILLTLFSTLLSYNIINLIVLPQYIFYIGIFISILLSFIVKQVFKKYCNEELLLKNQILFAIEFIVIANVYYNPYISLLDKIFYITFVFSHLFFETFNVNHKFHLSSKSNRLILFLNVLMLTLPFFIQKYMYINSVFLIVASVITYAVCILVIRGIPYFTNSQLLPSPKSRIAHPNIYDKLFCYTTVFYFSLCLLGVFLLYNKLSLWYSLRLIDRISWDYFWAQLFVLVTTYIFFMSITEPESDEVYDDSQDKFNDVYVKSFIMIVSFILINIFFPTVLVLFSSTPNIFNYIITSVIVLCITYIIEGRQVQEGPMFSLGSDSGNNNNLQVDALPNDMRVSTVELGNTASAFDSVDMLPECVRKNREENLKAATVYFGRRYTT